MPHGFPSSSGVATYSELAKRFRKLGKDLLTHKKVGTTGFQAEPLTGHTDNFFRDILKRSTRLSKAQFDDFFRGRLRGQDELISTASVRELVFGMLDALGSGGVSLTPTDADNLNKAFNNVSRSRMPTAEVGHSVRLTSTGPILRLQHPSGPGGGDFDRRAVNHGLFDRRRAERILTRMETEYKKSGSTIASVLDVAVATASAYTLNEGAAPLSAKNVRPFALSSGLGSAIVKDKVKRRERRLKRNYYLARKMPIPTSKQPFDADYKSLGSGDAPPSPFRF